MSIHSKRCSKCKTCKPVAQFLVDAKRTDGFFPYCDPCRLADPKPKKTSKAWTEFGRDVIAERFPEGGAEACLPFLPGRSLTSINVQASRQGVVRVKSNWSTPFQEFAADYRTWQAVDRKIRAPAPAVFAPRLAA